MEEVTDNGQNSTQDGTESLVFKITSELADATGVDIVDMPPLYQYIDLEALTHLFQPPAATGQFSVRCVTFAVENHRIQVFGDGSVKVSGMDDQESTVAED